MEERIAIGYRPLDRDGDMGGLRGRAQKERRFDVVVVCDGNESGELQSVFNLAAFEIEGAVRRKRRRPITGLVVQLEAEVAAVALAVCEYGTEDLVFASHVSEEIEGFLGQAGVAVKRNTGGEAS